MLEEWEYDIYGNLPITVQLGSMNGSQGQSQAV